LQGTCPGRDSARIAMTTAVQRDPVRAAATSCLKPTCTATSTGRSGSRPSSTCAKTADPAADVRQGRLRDLLVAGEQVTSLDDYLRVVRHHAVRDADRARARALRLRARRGRVARERPLHRGPLLAAVAPAPGLRPAQVVEAVLRGLRTRSASSASATGVILCAIRSLGPEQSLAHRRALRRVQEPRASSGSISRAPRSTTRRRCTARRFQLVIDNNINCTAHAGESFGPDSVHQAIHKCGGAPDRPRTRLIESGDLMNYVNDHRIRPRSAVVEPPDAPAASWETHPVDFYVDYALRVRSTPHRLMSNTTVPRSCTSAASTRVVAADDQGDHHRRASRARSYRTATKADRLSTEDSTTRAVQRSVLRGSARGEVTGRVGLVEADPPQQPAARRARTPKLVS